MANTAFDLVLINPGEREQVYQNLGNELTAVEPPLWCRLIAGYARDRGYAVRIIDCEAEGLDRQTVARQVNDLAPTLVVMVVFGHQPSASTQQMVGVRVACRAIKDQNPEQPILIVGGHASALPERTLREEAVDFVCKGEGPHTVVQLVDALKAPAPSFDTVAGLVWWKDGTPKTNKMAPLIDDLDADLHGNAWDLLPMARYRAHNWQCFGDVGTRQPYASIYTSLGCPYRCSFCCINAPFDAHRYRMRKPENVAAEVDHLYRTYGVRTFKIIDEMFVLNDRHVAAICEGLIGLGYADRLNFWAYARVDTVKAGMLDTLRDAGIRWLALGIESGSKHVRDGAHKALRQDDIVSIVREIQAAGIAVIGNFIFGLPDDTAETMRETLDLAKELRCEFANFYSAMAYPGSQLYTTAVANGWDLPDSWSGYSQHSYDCKPLPTQCLSSAEVLRFRDEAFQEYFADPGYLDAVSKRFGAETRQQIEGMVGHRLRRKLLEA